MKYDYDITLAFKKEWQKIILDWYSFNKRDLPWRKNSHQNFYKIWISEIMLQQTTVATTKNLLNIPGIGEYTSSSISAILKDESCAVIDGNIERILLRVFDLNRSEKNFKKKIKILAQKLTPLKNNKDYFQSLMDLANIICKNRLPQCVLCPINKLCKSNGKVNFKPSSKKA